MEHKITAPAIIRKFKNNKSTLVKRQKIAHFLPPPMRKALYKDIENKVILLSDFILGPLYNSGDLQIGMTGGVAEQEPKWVAACRELGEEIGLTPQSRSNLHPVFTGSYMRKRKLKLMKVYDLYIDEAIPVQEFQNGLKISSKKDHKNSKIGCFVFGERNRIKSFMDRPKIYIYKSNDGIQGIGAFKVSDIVTIMETHEI